MPRRQWGTLNWHKVGGDRIESGWTKRQQRVEFLYLCRENARAGGGRPSEGCDETDETDRRKSFSVGEQTGLYGRRKDSAAEGAPTKATPIFEPHPSHSHNDLHV